MYVPAIEINIENIFSLATHIYIPANNKYILIYFWWLNFYNFLNWVTRKFYCVGTAQRIRTGIVNFSYRPFFPSLAEHYGKRKCHKLTTFVPIYRHIR